MRLILALCLIAACSSAQKATEKKDVACVAADLAAVIAACGSATGVAALVCSVATLGPDIAICVAQNAGSGSAAVAVKPAAEQHR